MTRKIVIIFFRIWKKIFLLKYEWMTHTLATKFECIKIKGLRSKVLTHKLVWPPAEVNVWPIGSKAPLKCHHVMGKTIWLKTKLLWYNLKIYRLFFYLIWIFIGNVWKYEKCCLFSRWGKAAEMLFDIWFLICLITFLGEKNGPNKCKDRQSIYFSFQSHRHI